MSGFAKPHSAIFMGVMMRIAFAFFLLLAPSLATAEEIGRTQFNGRTIVLDSDQTWKYAESLAAEGSNCVPIASNVVPMELCLEESIWNPTKIDSDFEKAFASKSGFYIGLITEEIYVDRPTMKTVIVENAEAGAGANGVQGLQQADRTINGKVWLHSSFSFEYNNIEINMENFMYSREGFGTVQVAIWGASTSRQKFLDIAEEVAATLRIVN